MRLTLSITEGKKGNPCTFSTCWFDFPASRQDLAFTRLNHGGTGEPHVGCTNTGLILRLWLSRVLFMFVVEPVLV